MQTGENAKSIGYAFSGLPPVKMKESAKLRSPVRFRAVHFSPDMQFVLGWLDGIFEHGRVSLSYRQPPQDAASGQAVWSAALVGEDYERCRRLMSETVLNPRANGSNSGRIESVIEYSDRTGQRGGATENWQQWNGWVADTVRRFHPPQSAEAVARQHAAPLSASLAMAFFAHRFISPPTTFSGSTAAPCQPNAKVNATELALNLMAIAFWNLRENNLIRFAPVAERKLFFSYSTFAVEFNHSNQTKLPGLEFDLAEIVKRSAPGVTVDRAVYQFLEETIEYPLAKVFRRTTEWMTHLGYGQPAFLQRPYVFVRNAASFDFELAPDCRRVAAASGAAQSIHRAWTKFQSEQPDVFRVLYDAIKRAVESRTYRESSSSFDSSLSSGSSSSFD